MEMLKKEEPKKFLIKFDALISDDEHIEVEKNLKKFLTGDKNVYSLPCCVSSVLVFDSNMNLLYEIKNGFEFQEKCYE